MKLSNRLSSEKWGHAPWECMPGGNESRVCPRCGTLVFNITRIRSSEAIKRIKATGDRKVDGGYCLTENGLELYAQSCVAASVHSGREDLREHNVLAFGIKLARFLLERLAT